MTTMRDAVTRAARLVGIVGAGQEATGHDADDFLEIVQGAIDGLPWFRNGHWKDVLLTSDADYTASDGERISAEGFDPVITLPTTYVDDCGTTKIMRDLSRVHVIGKGLYVWSSDLAAWNKADDLALGDTFPFGPRDLPGLVALAALEAAPEHSDQPLATIVAERAQAALRSLRGRFWREEIVREPDAVYRTDYA
jgi:hypothetical protein